MNRKNTYLELAQILTVLFIFSSLFVGAQVSPVRSGGIFANVSYSGSSFSWSNVSNAALEDGVVAGAVPGGKNKKSDYLQVTNFGFNIPSGATISGIVARVKLRNNGSGQVVDEVVSLLKSNTTPVGDNLKKINGIWPNTLSFVNYGGIGNLWGTTWTPAEINSSSFGLVISVKNLTASGCNPQIDHVTIQVYYDFTTYHSKSLGLLTDPLTWGLNADGTGTSPSNFNADHVIYKLVNRASATLVSNWTVSGNNSKVVVGNGSGVINFTIPAAFSFSGTIDVSANATITNQNSSIPTFGELSPQSKVVYACLGNQSVTPRNYGILELSGSGVKLLTGQGVSATDLIVAPTVTFNTQGFEVGAEGNVTLSGLSTGNGKLALRGTSHQTVTGLATTFDNLEVSNPSGVTISAGITISSSLVLSEGTVDNSSNLLLMANGAQIIRDNGNLSASIPAGTVYDVKYVGSAKASGLELAGTVRKLTVEMEPGEVLTLNKSLTIENELVITSGDFDVSASNHSLNLKGNFINNGRFIRRGGSVNLNGLGLQVIGGDSATVFHDLVQANVFGVRMDRNVTVENSFVMSGGNIETGANVLTIGTGTGNPGSLTRLSGMVNGKIKRWFAPATVSNVLFPVGTGAIYRPASLTFTSAPSGGTIEANFNATQPGTIGLPLNDGAANITNIAGEGFWTIHAANGLTGGVYAVELFAEGFGNIVDVAGLRLVKRNDASSPWTALGTHQAGFYSGTTPVIRRSGLTGFSDFAMAGEPVNPLPVELVNFKVSLNYDNQVLLSWQTASEVNNEKFEIERSTNGKEWSTIGVVSGNGNSANIISYSFVDAFPLNGQSYYRLKQVDFDGKFEYSDVAKIKTALNNLGVYPNPVSGKLVNLNLENTDFVNNTGEISIITLRGRTVFSSVRTFERHNEVVLDGITPGQYLLVVKSGEVQESKIIIVE